jgi:hypothetical protein
LIRPVAAILAALNVAAPSFPHKEAAAPYVQRLADDGDFDPITLIAYIESESGWDDGAIGRQGGELYMGLGQARLRNYEACRTDLEAPPCLVVANILLTWRFNLDQTAQAFVWARERCRDLVGSGAFVGWMQTVKGYDKANGTTCGRRRVGNRWIKARVPAKVSALQKRIAQLTKAVE